MTLAIWPFSADDIATFESNMRDAWYRLLSAISSHILLEIQARELACKLGESATKGHLHLPMFFPFRVLRRRPLQREGRNAPVRP